MVTPEEPHIHVYRMQRFLSKQLMIIKWNPTRALTPHHFHLCRNLIQWLLKREGHLAMSGDAFGCHEKGETGEPSGHSPEVWRVCCGPNSSNAHKAPRGGSSCPGTHEEQEPRDGPVAFPRPESLRSGPRSLRSSPSSCAVFCCSKCHFHLWLLRLLCQCALTDPGTVTEA